MKKYLKFSYDAGTIAFHYEVLNPLYSGIVIKSSGDCREKVRGQLGIVGSNTEMVRNYWWGGGDSYLLGNI